MIKVYNAEYGRRYHAPFLSSASLCCAIAFLMTIFMPFFLAYATKQFWIKSNILYEQPKVSYTGELFINAATDKSSLSYCSLGSINQQFANSGLNPIVETSVEDSNNDGFNDLIRIRAILPLEPSKVSQVNMIVGISYELTGVSKIKMNTGFFVSFNTGAGASLIKAIGDVRLKLKELLPVLDKTQTLYNGEGIFEPLNRGSYMDALKSYSTRNHTLEYKNNAIILPYGGSQTTVELKIKVPMNEEIAYKTELKEMMKDAWIQYIYLLIPMYFVMYELIMWIIIKFKIVPSNPVEDDSIAHSS